MANINKVKDQNTAKELNKKGNQLFKQGKYKESI